MATIYRKTDKGRAEIATRAHRLPPRLRSALIMIDGQRDDADLAKLVASSDEVLQALAGQGFIEMLPPPPPPIGVRPATPASVTRGDDFISRRREAVRALDNAVGPASNELAVLIEKANDEMSLRPLLVMARESIRNVRGLPAAEAFTARFLS